MRGLDGRFGVRREMGLFSIHDTIVSRTASREKYRHDSRIQKATNEFSYVVSSCRCGSKNAWIYHDGTTTRRGR
jgi:hypothetical protein